MAKRKANHLATKPPQKLNLSLKAVKVHNDMAQETNCFSATICLDGQQVGFVQNDGHGGCHEYHWLNPEVGSRIETWAKTQPTEFNFEQLDQIIDDLLVKWESLARLKRWVKKDTMFRLKGQPKGQWSAVKGYPYQQRIVDHLITKYGEQIELILDPNNLEAGLPYC